MNARQEPLPEQRTDVSKPVDAHLIYGAQSGAAPLIESVCGELNRTSPSFAAGVVALDIQKAPTQVVKVSAASARLLNAAGDPIGTAEVILESRPDDVAGVLPHSVQGEQLYVFALECLRPALAVRAERGLPPLGGTVGNRVLGELGGYLTHSDGLNQAVLDILAVKSKLQASGPVEYLGNLVTPNPGISAELSVPAAVPVLAPAAAETFLEGSAFEASRVVVRLSAQDVVRRFFSGTLSDPRLFEDTVELHDNLLEQDKVRESLQPPAALKAIVADRLQATGTKYTLDVPLLSTAGEVLDYLGRGSNDGTFVSSLEFGEFHELPPDALYETFRLAVENRNQEGRPVGNAYTADAIVRKHDMLDIVVLARLGDSIVMPVNIGVRPSLACRDITPHVLHTVTEERNLEGVTGSLTVPYDDRSAVASQVRTIVKRLTGHDVVGEPLLTAMQGYWSPGFNATGFRMVIAVIQLDEKSRDRLPPQTAFARPAALLNAHVRDLPLRLAARVASLLTDEHFERESALAPDERPGFRAIMGSSDQVNALIREHSQRVLSVKQKHPEIANLLTKRTNAGGLLIERPAAQDPERFFFNSLMQSFTVHGGDHPLRVVQLLVHDCWHYEHPDPVPFQLGSDGKLRPAQFEQYRDRVMANEIDALMFSDVVLPEICGVSTFEAELGERSLASLLRNSGLTDRDAQRAAVASALEHGELPEPIVEYLHHSKTFAEYEHVIREKLLGYHVRDTLKNARILYDAWASMPAVARVALDMGVKTIDAARSSPALYSQRVQRLITQADGSFVRTGRNPLQEELGFAKTYGAYQTALRLQYVKGLLREDVHAAHRKAIDGAVSSLVGAWKNLDKAWNAVQSIEESPINAAAYRQLLRARETVITPAAELLRQLESDSGPLTAAERTRLRNHRHAPFPLLSFDERSDADAQREVTELIRSSYTRCGLPSPVS